MKGFGNILKQAQEMHAKIAQLQEELAARTVDASAGGGMVTVVVSGKQEVVSIRLDPEVVNRDEIEMLQDLIRAATNEAIRKSQEMMTEEMKKSHGRVEPSRHHVGPTSGGRASASPLRTPAWRIFEEYGNRRLGFFKGGVKEVQITRVTHQKGAATGFLRGLHRPGHQTSTRN